MPLEEKTVRSRCVYDGKLLKVRHDDVTRGDGSPGWREWVEHPSGVIVVPVHDDGRVVMLRQFRYAVQRVMNELPAGLRDIAGEDILRTAARELSEETGYTAERLTHLGQFFSQSGFSTDGCDIVLAEGLKAGEQDLEPGEVVECFELPLDEAIAMQLDGETDARTLLALLLAQRQLKKKASPS